MNIKYQIIKNKDYIKDIIAYVKIKYLWIGVVVVWGIARVLTGICVASEAAARVITILAVLMFVVGFGGYMTSRFYTKITRGRSYLYDSHKYRRKYIELIDYFRNANPHLIDKDKLPKMTWQDSNGIILGKVEDRLLALPPDVPYNISIFGQPGDGKTAGPIGCTALQYAGSVFAIDIKGDLSKITKERKHKLTFNLENPDKSWHYDPLAGIAGLSPDERSIFLENISFILYPEVTGEGAYFQNGARNYFNGIANLLIDEMQEEGAAISLPYIACKIVEGNAFDYVTQAVNGDSDLAKRYLASFYGQNEKNVAGCYDACVAALRLFASDTMVKLLTDNGKCIAPEQMEKGYDIYIRVHQKDLELYSPLITVIVQQFINAFMTRPEGAKRPFLMILDEFGQLRRMNAINSAFATLRSKNVKLMLAMQSRAQIEKHYGKEGTTEIMDCTQCILILGVQDPESRKYFSDLLGTKKVLKISNNIDEREIQKGRIVSESREPIFEPAQFGALGDYLVIYLKGRYILAEKQFYFK